MFYATLLTGNLTPDSHMSPQIVYNDANAHTSGCSVQHKYALLSKRNKFWDKSPFSVNVVLTCNGSYTFSR